MHVWRTNDHSYGQEIFCRLLVHDHFVAEAAFHAGYFFRFGIDAFRDELEMLEYVSGRITLPSCEFWQAAEDLHPELRVWSAP